MSLSCTIQSKALPCCDDAFSYTVLEYVCCCDPFARSLSLKDWSNLSRTGRYSQQAVTYVLSNSLRFKRIVQALAASVPELQAVLSREHLTSPLRQPMSRSDLGGPEPTSREPVQECVKPLGHDHLYQLRKIVSFLETAPEDAPWKPVLATTPGILGDPAQLMTVPHVPRELAEYSVQHLGVRMQYQQFLKAVRNGVAGVQVWVQVQQQLGIVTDIPDNAVAVCSEVLDLDQLVAILNALQVTGDLPPGEMLIAQERPCKSTTSSALETKLIHDIAVAVHQTAEPIPVTHVLVPSMQGPLWQDEGSSTAAHEYAQALVEADQGVIQAPNADAPM